MRGRKNRKVFEVMETCCDQCLFTDRKVVGEETKTEMLEGCRRKNGYFTCHKASLAGRDICCRGFYENEKTLVVLLAQDLDLVRFVKLEPETEKKQKLCRS